MKSSRILVQAIIFFQLSGCVFYPRVVPKTAHEERCEMVARRWQLNAGIDEGIPCSGQNGAECLAVLGAVAVVSGVVAGSVVLVGNSLYWLEKQGRCPEQVLEEARGDHLESGIERGGVPIGDDVNPVTAGAEDQD